MVIGLVIGLVIGSLLAGTAGYFVGTSVTDRTAAPSTTTAPSPSASLPPYEASQLAVNKLRLDGELATIATPWLPWMGGCAANTDDRGPGLPPDQKKIVLCRYGGLFVYFSLFKSDAEKDKARANRERLNLDGRGVAPGIEPPTRKTGGSSQASGNYVEYAFQSNDGRARCGLWWDRDDSLAALLIETLCQDGLGGNWEPLRDVWQRHS